MKHTTVMKTSKHIITLALTICCAVGNLYAINSTYYSSLDGKKDSGLREALTTLVYNKHTTGLSYDWTFDGIDWDSNGNVYDIYSDCGHKKTDETGSYKCCCDAINREHIVPQSIFDSKQPQYADRHHLFVVDGKANGYRSNYAFGECSNGTKGTCSNSSTVKPSEGKATCTNHEFGKLGTSTFSEVQVSDKVYEPGDEYKGDIARAIMYMVIRYATTNECRIGSGSSNAYPVTTWSASSNCGLMFSGSLSTNYGLSNYGKALLLKWHRNDPVSAKEIARNDGVAAKQGNRNPFIDYPCLAEYLWGNKAGETVTLSELVGTFTGSWTTGDGCPCGTDPAITLPTGAIDCGSTSANTPVTKTITVQGVNLTGNLTLGVSGGNSSLFSLNATTILKAAAEAGTTVNITYTPTSAGTHSTTLTISGGGLASSRTFDLSGTCCNPYTVTLSRNGITETIGACGTYTLPTAENEADPCDGWEFQGWITDGTSFTENQTTAPSYTSSVSSATTLYAVYAKTTTGAPRRATMADTWTKVTDASTLKSGDVLVIACNTQDATAGDISSQIMASVSSTFSTDKSTITSLGSGTVELTLGGSSGSWTLSKGTSALGATAAKKLAWGSGTTTWSISISSGNATITNGTSSYGTMQYNSTSPRFTTYTSGQTAVQLYRKSGGSTSTTNYKKEPCTTYTISYSDADGIATGGMYWADVTSALSGATVTLDNEPAKNYEFTGWTVTKAGGGSVTVTNDQFTMPAANVTVKANFNALCTGELETPNVTATPGNNKITLTWPNVTNATSYDVTIGTGVGYTTECSTPTIGAITNSGGTNTCVITGLVNGLDYTTSVVAQSTTYCDSPADEDTTTPKDCDSWSNPTLYWNTYTLTVGGAHATKTLSGTTHGTLSFTSSNEDVLRVNESTGEVTPYGAGTATITAHWTAEGNYCAKDMESATFTVKGTVVLTFNANDGSANPATTTQNFTYGEAQTLDANTFSRTGYTFIGWALEPDATSSTIGNGTSYTITEATTLYAVWEINKYQVSFNPSPAGATIKVNNSSSTPVTNVAYGSTVTITITPAAHYSIDDIRANGGDVALSGTGNTRTFTMPAEDVTVTVVMVEDTKYTVNWYVSGTLTAEVNYAGEALAGISDPTIDCNDKVFVGWTSHSSYNSDDVPDDLFTSLSGLVMPSNNSTNYYAVFADEVTSGSGSAGWSETAITDLTSSDVFVIVGTNNSGAYAMTNDNGTSSAPAATSVTISDGKISSTVADNLKWNISGNATDGYTFYPNGSTSTWLYCTNTNNGVRVGTNDNKAFTISSGYLYNTATSRYVGIYNSSDWRCYTSSSTNIGGQSFAFYKYASGGTTTYTGYTTSCTAPTEVTVIFNANGGTGTMSDQVVSYNNATALTANAFTRTGYSFAGWATTADGSKAYDNQESVTLTKNTTLYALWTKNSYNVSFTPTMTGQATITVNGSSTSPQTVEYESTVSIAITPDVAYTVSGVTVTGGVTPSGSGNNWSFTMPASDVTVTVTLAAKPTYTIRFLNNGNVVSSQTVIQGQTAVKPTDPTPCDEDYTFEGWWTSTLAEDNETEHTWVTDFTATQNQDYYAVFSYSEEGEGGGTFDGSTPGTYKIYALVGSTKYYATGNLGQKISSTTNEAEATEFTFESVTGGMAIKKGTSYVTYSSSTNLGSSNSAYTWTFASGTKGTWRVNSETSGRAWIFRASTTNQFGGYSTGNVTASGTEYYDLEISGSGSGSSTTYYTTAPVCEACTNKVALTKGTPTNGTFTLDKDNGEYENCKSKGFVVTVSDITPDEDYEFDAITQTGINSGVTIDQNAKTVTYAQNVSGNSTINVTFKHKTQYTIKFVDDGSVISEQLVTINKSAVKPSDPEGCEEYVFLGWWTEELGSDNTTAKTWITNFTATQNQTYYAVYKHTEEGGVGAGTETYGFEDADDATNWTISEAIAKHTDAKATGTYGGKINTNNTYITYKNKVAVTNFSFKFAKTSNNNNYNVYIETSTDNSTWTAAATYPMSDFSNGSFTAKSKDFDGATELYVRFHCYNTTAVRYVDDISISYGGGGTTYYTTHPECRDCAVPTINFTNATVNKFDGDAPFRITPVIDGNTMGATVSYTSSNPTKAEVSDDGTVTIHDAMSNEPITITATLGKMSTEEKCQKSVKASYILNIYNKVTWLVNGTPCAAGSQTTQTTEGGTIDTAPSEPDGDEICFGKTFVGWTTAEYEEDDAKPEVLYTSSSIVGQHITESTTFYAVFAELTGTLNQYRKGTPTQLTTGQKVIIVNTAAKKAMKAASSFKNGYDVTPVGDAFVTEEQTIIWTVEQVDGGGYYFMYDGKYLNAATTSLYLDGDEDAWTVTGAGPYIISSGKYPSYSLEWYGGEFKSYTTGSGDAFNMDLYFPNWTIGAYATTCGLCLPKPEVTSTIIKSDRATITWKSVANATGYDFTCSGGEVSISGTTATITGLTPLADYTYIIRAQGGAPYTCFRTTNGSFSTPDCDDMPYDITATPYNVVQAIIRWKAEAERGKVVVYNDEACTDVRVTIADTISPCTVSGLVEDTRYWFKVFGGASQDCASPVQTFLTQTTAVEIVEWQNDGVIILLTGDETTASVLIEDKQEHVEHAGNVADKLFISKYFEADGNNKMIAVYNGTKETIDITNYWLKHSNKGSAETKICLKKFGKTPGQIAPNEEIIIMRFSTSTDPAIECAKEEENYDEWNIIESNDDTDGEGNNIYSWLQNISGPQSVGLYDGTTMIDVIGARTSDNKLVQIEASNKVSCSYATNSNNDGAGFSARGLERGTEDSITLSTNRCLLIRKNTVKSGDNAVATNVHSVQEECSEAIAKAFKTLSDEWVGYVIGKDASRTCQGLAEVGGFDYEGYYASYDTAVVVQELVQNPDGTISIPIEGLDTMSCTMMRINVYDKNTKEQKASREYRIPIMVQSGEVKSTNELFTKHGEAVCKDCDVLVFSGATLKKDNDGEDRDEIGNLTLYPGSTLELPEGKGDYHVKSITYRVEGDSVPVTKLNADLYTETQRLIVTRRIKNDRYYFISFPYDVNVNEITLANGSKAVNGKDFRLMEYDAETRAQEGSLQGVPGHWKLFLGDKLTAGQGYAIAVNTKAMKEIMFPMTLDSKNLTTEERTKTTNTVTINEYVGEARNTNHNWNLIAHPYITKFEVTTGATNVEAYWEDPHRYNTDWIDDWQTWPEEDPTQGGDDPTGEVVERGTVENGIDWTLYADGTMALTGGGQMVDFSSLDAVPWAQRREEIKSLKVGGEVQKIGSYAFGQCTSLESVIIVAPVSNLASQAFSGCTGLRTFRIENSQQFVSATTTTFDGINNNSTDNNLSMISLQVPQSMYNQYSAKTPWNKMTISTFDDGTNTSNPAPRRAAEHPEGWTESAGGIYVTIPVVRGGKVDYDQYWINEVKDIKPFTAVFIQGDGLGQMTFDMSSSSPAPKRMLQTDRCETRDHTVFVGVAISGNGQKDKTSLRLRPDFTEEYKFNLDLLKFTVFNTARPQIYFKTENEQLAFRAVSDSLAASTWLPVGVYCRDAGEYTFSLHDGYVWDEVEAVYLRDNTTGVETNLLIGNYSITTTGQIYTNTRFAVKVLLRRKHEVDTPTMIDHTEDPNAPRKFFRDGLLYILRNGKVYDMTGKPVQFDDMLNR